jgi:hypothetical protein
MKEQSKKAVVDLEDLRKWVSVVNPYFLAVRRPEVFEKMGFPSDIVRKCVRKHRNLCLNDGTICDAYGVSDGEILVILAEGIGADTSQGKRYLCTSNKVRAWQDACLARLDEIENQKS